MWLIKIGALIEIGALINKNTFAGGSYSNGCTYWKEGGAKSNYSYTTLRLGMKPDTHSSNVKIALKNK